MKYMRELCIVFIALLVIATNCYSQTKEDISIPEYLSIEESLLPIFHDPYYLSSGNFPFNRINPDIKEYLHFYLEEDNSIELFGARAISLLGYIGNKDDIQFVDNYLQELLKSLNHERQLDTNIAHGSGCFSGMMIKRKIEGAEAFFKKYAQVSAWYPPGEGDPELTSNARNAYSVFLMMAYEFSHEGYVLQSLQTKSTTGVPYSHELPFSRKESATGSTRRYESVVEMLMTRKTDLYTQSMEPVKISEDKLNEDLDKSLKGNSSVIEALVNKQTLAEWQKGQEEQNANSSVEKKTKAPFEIIDMNETVEGASIKAIAIDAVKAYQQARIDEDMESTLIKNEILQDVQTAGFKNFNNFNVKVEVDATIDNFVPSKSNDAIVSEPNIVTNKVKVNITFDIQGSAEILKKYDPDAVHASIISPKTGDLIAVMIRLNNAWRWAPFTDSSFITDSNIVDNEYLIDSANQAMIAYKQITQSIIDGNYDPLTIPVLNNNKLIPLKKRERQKDEMAEAVDVEKKILEDLAKAGLNNYKDFNMKLTLEATLDNGTLNIESGTMPKNVKGYETADLTFIIPNGADAYKEHISVEFEENSDGKGNLKVTMKRINGTWYWNPFGW
ncbi:MAG: hypothetical protein P8016_16050 [Sedimentisphaerales bacterium]